jgi:hypothetical protein
VSVDDRFEPERIVAALNDADVRYVIVGGLAVGAHGVIRATRDLALVPKADRSNLDRLAQVLIDLLQMKRASERPRDAVDLAELDELHGPEHG